MKLDEIVHVRNRRPRNVSKHIVPTTQVGSHTVKKKHERDQLSRLGHRLEEIGASTNHDGITSVTAQVPVYLMCWEQQEEFRMWKP